jgi:hypothetical protein
VNNENESIKEANAAKLTFDELPIGSLLDTI